MSLESAEWRHSGPPPPPATRPPSVGDRLARGAALVILVVFFSFSAFAVSLSPFGENLIIGVLVVGLVFLLFRVRELGREVREHRAALEALRAPPPPAVADEKP